MIMSQNVVSPTLIEATIEVDEAAAIGFRQAQVTTGSSFETKARSIFVNGTLGILPEIVSAIPGSAEQGSELAVAVVGSNTNFESGVTTASFGDGIDVISVTVTDSTHATVQIAVQPNASVGFRTVLLTTGDETAVQIDGFFVHEKLRIQSVQRAVTGEFTITWFADPTKNYSVRRSPDPSFATYDIIAPTVPGSSPTFTDGNLPPGTAIMFYQVRQNP